MPDDRSLIAEVLAGRTDRFRLLVERYQGPVFAIARSFGGRGLGAEDVAQDTFLSAFARLRQFDAERGAFRTWLLTIARNRCRDLARRPRSHGLDPAPLPAPPQAGPDTETFRMLDGALAALPPERRVVFLLVDVYGLPLVEVARIVDAPLGTVKSRAARARDALRGQLGALKEESR